jgi:short-subunit dehydrogenase
MSLVLSARNASKLEEVAAECRKLGADVRVIAADVSVAADRERLVREAGDVDVLVNNAGVEFPLAVVDQSPEEVSSQIQTNLVAPIELSRLVLAGMLARRRGVIVNVSSMSGKSPTPYNAIYAATKHGLNGFTSSLRLELDGTGVHAGVVCPSFMAESGMWADTGLRAPAALREVKPEKFVRAVLSVLSGAAEVLVTPGPVRPLLALGQMAPKFDGTLLRRMGVMSVLKARADAHKRSPG